jgi:hypothetical protein
MGKTFITSSLSAYSGVAIAQSVPVGTATGLLAGRPGFDSQQEQEIFLFSTASRPTLGSIQLPIQGVPRDLSPGVKRPEREADHSPTRLHGVVPNSLSTGKPLLMPLPILILLQLLLLLVLKYIRPSYTVLRVFWLL